MRQADEYPLEQFAVPHECKCRVGAPGTPAGNGNLYALTAAGRGLEVIIVGAGGAAHLPGMVAAQTGGAGHRRAGAERRAERPRLPVIHCPDAEGRPRRHGGDLRVGRGQRGLLAVAILANSRPELRAKLQACGQMAERIGRESLP